MISRFVSVLALFFSLSVEADLSVPVPGFAQSMTLAGLTIVRHTTAPFGVRLAKVASAGTVSNDRLRFAYSKDTRVEFYANGSLKRIVLANGALKSESGWVDFAPNSTLEFPATPGFFSNGTLVGAAEIDLADRGQLTCTSAISFWPNGRIRSCLVPSGRTSRLNVQGTLRLVHRASFQENGTPSWIQTEKEESFSPTGCESKAILSCGQYEYSSTCQFAFDAQEKLTVKRSDGKNLVYVLKNGIPIEYNGQRIENQTRVTELENCTAAVTASGFTIPAKYEGHFLVDSKADPTTASYSGDRYCRLNGYSRFYSMSVPALKARTFLPGDSTYDLGTGTVKVYTEEDWVEVLPADFTNKNLSSVSCEKEIVVNL